MFLKREVREIGSREMENFEDVTNSSTRKQFFIKRLLDLLHSQQYVIVKSVSFPQSPSCRNQVSKTSRCAPRCQEKGTPRFKHDWEESMARVFGFIHNERVWNIRI